MAKPKQEFSELVSIIHPNYLEVFFSIIPAFMQSLVLEVEYLKSRPELKPGMGGIDWNRYRKEMFNRYGRAVREAAQNPNAIVAIVTVAVPLSVKRTARNGRPESSSLGYYDASRLVSFAKKQLGNRLIVVEAGDTDLELEKAAEKVSRIARGRGFSFKPGLLVRGMGESSENCIAKFLRHSGKFAENARTVVEKKYCGDVLEGVKPRRIGKHTHRKDRWGAGAQRRKKPPRV